ncbi:MAG: PAS domain S-box protein [Methanomicrobiales archaeon]
MPGALRILYVDDEPGLLQIGKLFLEQSGDFSVETIDSAPNALELLKSEQFDAIVSDYQMPEIDGIQFLKQLKESGNTTPFIIFTGKGREEVVIQALNEGADFYLQKGGDPQAQFAELSHKIRIAIQQRRAGEALREKTSELDRFFNSSPDLLCISDTDGHFRRLNPEWERTLGYPLSELEGLKFLDLVHPEDLAPTLKTMLTLGGQKEILNFSNRYLHKDGSYRWIEWRSYPFGEFIYSAARDITERKRAEEALRESEERYRNIVEDQTEFISRFLPDGTHIFVNEAYCRYFGFTRHDLLGHRFRPAIPLEDRERVNQFFRSLTPDNPVDTIEHRIIMPDGTIRWQRWSDRAIFDPSGSVIEYQSVGHDITEIKEAEEELRKSGTKFRSLFDNAILGIFQTTPEGRYIDLNPAFARIYGYNSPEEMKSAISDIQQQLYVHPEDRKTIRELLSTVGEFRNFETENRYRDGHSIWISINAKAVPDRNGEILAYEGTIEDITERRRAEEALRLSGLKFRMLVEASPDMVWEMDSQGNFLYISPQCAIQLGYAPEELIGKPIFSLIKPESVASIRNQFLLHMRDKKSFNLVEVPAYHRNGNSLVIEVRSVLIANDKGEITGFQGIARDITGRKRAEELLKVSEEHLRSTLASIDDLVLTLDEHDIFTGSYNPVIANLYVLPEQFMGKSIREVLPEELADLVQTTIEEVKITGATHQIEYGLPIQGKTEWFNAKISPRYSLNAAYAGVTLVARNITGRKTAEEALRESEEKYHNLYLHSAIGIFHSTFEGRFIDVNPALATMLGYNSPEEVITSISNIAGQLYAEPPLYDSTAAAVLDSGGIISVENCYLRRDGTLWHGNLHMRIVPDKQGKPGHYEGFVEDVTERRRIEEALRITRDKYTQVFFSNPDAITISDLETGWFVEVNDAASHMFEYPRDEMIGKSALELGIWRKKEDWDAFTKWVKTVGWVERSELCGRQKSGTLFHASVSADTISIDRRMHIICVIRDITDSKIAEQALRESECRFRTIFGSTFEFMALLQPDGRILGMNETALEFGGFSLRDVIQKLFWEIHWWSISPDTQTRLKDAVARVAAGEFVRYEVEILGKDNQEITIDFSLKPVRGAPGTVTSLIAEGRDITERKQGEAALIEAKARTSTILDSIVDTFFSLDDTWRFTTVNPAAEHAPFGRPATELLGQVIWELYPGLVGTRSYQHYLDCAKNNSMAHYDVPSPLNGRWYEVFVHGQGGGVDVYMRDITEQKQAEEALRGSEQRLRRFTESGLFGVIFWNMDGKITDANDKFLEMVGYSREDLTNGLINGFTLTPPEFAHIDECSVAELKANGVNKVAFEKEYIRKDGMRIPVILAGAMLDDKRFEGVAFVLDITERKEAEVALIKSNRQLTLLSGITRHDIMNKITTILGYLSLAEMEVKTPRAMDYLSNIELATRAICSQIEFTKVYENLGTHEPQWQDLNIIIAISSRLPSMIKLNADVKGIEVYADPMLERVFFNLLDNAVRHGEHVSEIRVSSCQSDDLLTIIWQDNGVGIPVDEKGKIFERGFGKNTGLGMFLVREVLSLTGIAIKENGEPGKGARFEMTAPKGMWRTTGNNK